MMVNAGSGNMIVNLKIMSVTENLVNYVDLVRS